MTIDDQTAAEFVEQWFTAERFAPPLKANYFSGARRTIKMP